jgi:hypothetical protein
MGESGGNLKCVSERPRCVPPEMLRRRFWAARSISGWDSAVAVSQSSLVRAHAHMHTEPELCLSLSLCRQCIFTLERRVSVLFALRWRWRPWPLSKANGEIWTNFAKEYSPSGRGRSLPLLEHHLELSSLFDRRVACYLRWFHLRRQGRRLDQNKVKKWYLTLTIFERINYSYQSTNVLVAEISILFESHIFFNFLAKIMYKSN